MCGRGGSAYDLEMALTNSDFRTAAEKVRRIVGRPDLHPVESEPPLKWGLLGSQHQYLRERIEKVESEKGWKQNAIYPYFEADGKFSYVKVRFIDKQNDKAFRQYALSSNGGWISRKQAGKIPILYRLNKLAAADEVFIVNGEKAADRVPPPSGSSRRALPTARASGAASTRSPDRQGGPDRRRPR